MLLTALLLLLPAGWFPYPDAARRSGVDTISTPHPAFDRIAGLGFEANRGQFDDGVRYVLRSGASALLLSQEGASVVFWHSSSGEESFVQIRFAGASTTMQVEGLDELAAVSNYLVGKDPERWVTGAAHFGSVRYRGVYPGVDLTFHIREAIQRVEYVWTVAPGADSSRIRLVFQNAETLTVDAGGELVVRSAAFEMRHGRPFAYQDVEGVRKPVAVRFQLHGQREAGFELGEYDPGRALTIDPILEYSSVFGGSGFMRGYEVFRDHASGIAVDGLGNAYVAGQSYSFDFSPVTYSFTGENVGGFVAKLDPQGSIAWVTILGFQLRAIAVDTERHAYVTGTGWKDAIPFTSLFLSGEGNGEVYIGKLNPSGSALVYSVLVGGSGSEGGYAIAVDAEGNAYVTGITSSRDFPITTGVVQPRPATTATGNSEAFVLKLR